MKKYLLLALLLVASPVFAAGSVTPNYYASRGNAMSLFLPVDNSEIACAFQQDGSFFTCRTTSENSTFARLTGGLGNFHVVFVNATGYGDCSGATYSQCISNGTAHSGIVQDVLIYYPSLPPPPPPAFNTLISSAENGFASSTGETIASTTSWAANNVILLFIGSGLAVLYNLRYWIMALLIISVITTWAFLAFRYYRTGSLWRK